MNPDHKKEKGKKKKGRRRRGKKDIILDFRKRAKPSKSCLSDQHGSDVGCHQGTSDTLRPGASRSVGKRKKMSLATSSKDYGDNLGLPDKVTQRECETTGQFFRRLDRLVAKAKVEAAMDEKFCD